MAGRIFPIITCPAALSPVRFPIQIPVWYIQSLKGHQPHFFFETGRKQFLRNFYTGGCALFEQETLVKDLLQGEMMNTKERIVKKRHAIF